MAITARQMFRNSRDSRWGTQTLIGNHPLILTKCISSRVFHLHGVHDWVNHYGLYVSQMTTDMFHLSESQSGPFFIHDLSPCL